MRHENGYRGSARNFVRPKLKAQLAHWGGAKLYAIGGSDQPLTAFSDASPHILSCPALSRCCHLALVPHSFCIHRYRNFPLSLSPCHRPGGSWSCWIVREQPSTTMLIRCPNIRRMHLSCAVNYSRKRRRPWQSDQNNAAVQGTEHAHS